jgi:UDP:flavonoid glycosyltransferase YjiC (YdhE family)
VSTFLFASIPVPAHTANPLPFAARLVERGHRVLWYAGAAFHPQIAAIGAEPLPYRDAEDFGGKDLTEHWSQYRGLSPVQTIRRVFADVFVGHAPERVSDIRRIIAEHHVDAILCDGLMVGVGLVGELEEVPWATFGDGPLPFEEPDTPPFGPGLKPMRGPIGRLRNAAVRTVARRFIFADADRVYRRVRSDLNLPAADGFVLDEMSSPYLHLQGCTPGFEYPHRALPPQVHWVGALRPDVPKDWTPPSWWPEVTGSTRPVVVVSQGSIRPDVGELLEPTITGLAGSDVLVVVTTGSGDPDQLVDRLDGQVPSNVRITRFVPYDLLLEHADVFVTNGGYTGVTLALAHGVPIVQAGTTEEKAEIAARIEWTGVGVKLGTTTPTPAAVRSGVEKVLAVPAFAAAAERLRQEMAAHDAGREGADLLEQLATTGRLVPRVDAAIDAQVPVR